MERLYNAQSLRELYHHGVQGMHWGVRRYQSYDAGYQAADKGRFVGSASKVKNASSTKKSTKAKVLTKEELRAQRDEERWQKKANRAIERADRKAMKKTRKEELERRLNQKTISDAVSKLDAATMRKHPEWFTNEQLKAANERAKILSDFESMRANADTVNYMKRIGVAQATMSTVKTATETVNAGSNVALNILRYRAGR